MVSRRTDSAWRDGTPRALARIPCLLVVAAFATSNCAGSAPAQPTPPAAESTTVAVTQSTSGSAEAGERSDEPLVALSPAATSALLAALLHSETVPDRSDVRLADARYCGRGPNASVGRAMVAYTAPRAMVPPVDGRLLASDCELEPSNVARRLTEAYRGAPEDLRPTTVWAATLHLEREAATLRATVQSVSSGGPQTGTAWLWSTAGLRVDSGRIDLEVVFATQSVLLVVRRAPASSPVAIVPGLIEELTGRTSASDFPEMGALAVIPTAWVDDMIPEPVRIDDHTTAHDVQLETSDTALALIGRIHSTQFGGDADGRVQLDSDTLAIREISLDARLPNCDGLTGLPRIQCLARRRLIGSAVTAYASRLTERYRGRSFDPLARDGFDVQAGSRSLRIVGATRDARYGSGKLEMTAQFTIEER